MTNKEFDKMIDMIRDAYISVMGIEKWESLTDREKHDVIMIIAKDFSNALNNIA